MRQRLIVISGAIYEPNSAYGLAAKGTLSRRDGVGKSLPLLAKLSSARSTSKSILAIVRRHTL